MSTSWGEAKKAIKQDIYRNLGRCTGGDVFRAFTGSSKPISLLVYFRICHYYTQRRRKSPFGFLMHGLCYLKFRRLQIKMGVEMNQHTEIGYGLRLPHRGGIVIHPLTIIGNNCEIMQGVTIGNNILKDRDAVATIGDEVLICAGAKLIGGIAVGNTVVIGANAVVTHDIPDHTIVGGIPAKVIGQCDNRFVINRYEDVSADS